MLQQCYKIKTKTPETLRELSRINGSPIDCSPRQDARAESLLRAAGLLGC